MYTFPLLITTLTRHSIHHVNVNFDLQISYISQTPKRIVNSISANISD